MHRRVGADALDVHISCASGQGHLRPLAPGQLDGVAGVGDHTDTCIQDVRCHPVRQAIPLALNMDRAQVAQGLFDGVSGYMRFA